MLTAALNNLLAIQVKPALAVRKSDFFLNPRYNPETASINPSHTKRNPLEPQWF